KAPRCPKCPRRSQSTSPRTSSKPTRSHNLPRMEKYLLAIGLLESSLVVGPFVDSLEVLVAGGILFLRHRLLLGFGTAPKNNDQQEPTETHAHRRPPPYCLNSPGAEPT